MENLIVSFIVPTFNRSKYCISLIKSISYLEGNFEVIISDNSTDKILLDFIKKNRIDDRIIYKYTNKKLNMTQNINRAISFAKGYYLCCIGDDDIVMPNCIQYLNEFKNRNLDLISPKITINYCWPDFSSKYIKNSHKSRLYFKISKPFIKQHNSKEAFKKLQLKCFQGTDKMPKLYHGFAKREYFENIKKITGDYLFGSSPDISASILLLNNSNCFFETNIPLTIPGASSGSNTSRAAKKKHFGKIEDEIQTKDFVDNWPEILPKIFTVETVWAHSALLSLEKLNIKNINFNTTKFNSLVLTNNIRSFKYLKEYIFHLNFLNFLNFSSNFIKHLIHKLFNKLIRIIIPTASGGRNYFSSIHNLEQVILKARTMRPIGNFDIKNSIQIIKNFKF